MSATSRRMYHLDDEAIFICFLTYVYVSFECNHKSTPGHHVGGSGKAATQY